MASVYIFIYGLAFLLRVSMFKSSISTWVSSRVEVSSPLTAWKRVIEALALQEVGLSPYSGDVVHETPLLLAIMKILHEVFGQQIHLVFLAVDILIAFIISHIVRLAGQNLLQEQKHKASEYSPSAKKWKIEEKDIIQYEFYAVTLYLLSPFSVMTCISLSTGIFSNLALALVFLFTLQGRRWPCTVFVAIATYLSFYPLMLAVPAAMQITLADSGKKRNVQWLKVAHFCLGVVMVFCVLVYLSFLLEGSWNFLYNTFGFILSVPELTPNVGIFWYFFTEMFEHFRLFFICVFQINAFIYTLPLAFRLKDSPIFLMYILLFLLSIFKSYPSYADMCLVLGLMPLWSHCYYNLRNSLIVFGMLLVSVILLPLLHHLWIYAGSANANFYFAITLVYSCAQIFLVTDILYAFLRHEFNLYNGPGPYMINGKASVVMLKSS